MSKILDIENLSSELNLTDSQKQLLSEAIEKIMDKYILKNKKYFYGVVDGLNHSYKLINGIDDSYNSN